MDETYFNSEARESLLERLSSWVFVVFGALFPIFFIPISYINVPISKGALLAVATILALILWIFGRLKEGSFVLPKSWIVVSALAIPVIYLVSSFFSTSRVTSLIGSGSQIDTFAIVLFSILLSLLISLVANRKETLKRFFAGFFVSLLVVTVFHVLRFIFGNDFLSFGLFNASSSNIVGKWNELGIFFGLGALISLLALELGSQETWKKILLYLSFIASLFFLVLVNFTLLWYVLGSAGFVLFVYFYVFSNRGSTKRKVSIPPLVLIIISLTFILSGSLIGDAIANVFSINQLEARPSWTTTYQISKGVIKESPLLGVGPNRFVTEWVTNKPRVINETLFWSIDFNEGIGFIPSTPVTTGALGFLSWVVFLILFLSLGIKSLFSEKSSAGSFVTVASFVASLYLILFLIFYVPSISIFVLTFLFIGVFLGSAIHSGDLPTKTLRFSSNPKINFASVLLSVLLVIMSVTAGYFIVERYLADILAKRAVFVLNTEGDVDAAEDLLVRSVRLSENDEHLRTLTDLRILKLNAIINSASGTDEEVRTQFQNTLAGAVASAQQAIQVDIDNYQNYLVLGRIYDSIARLNIQGALENAIVAYAIAKEKNPLNPEVPLIVARLESALGNFDAARVEIVEALNLKNNYTSAIFLLSQIEVAEGNLSKAIQSIEVASVISPNNQLIFFQLGILRYSSQDYTAAVSAFERAVSLDTNYANARYFLGLGYDILGRRDDAIVQFEEIEKTNTDNQEVKFILRNLRADLPPFSDALPPIDDSPESRDSLPISDIIDRLDN